MKLKAEITIEFDETKFIGELPKAERLVQVLITDHALKSHKRYHSTLPEGNKSREYHGEMVNALKNVSIDFAEAE